MLDQPKPPLKEGSWVRAILDITYRMAIPATEDDTVMVPVDSPGHVLDCGHIENGLPRLDVVFEYVRDGKGDIISCWVAPNPDWFVVQEDMDAQTQT